MVVRGSKRQLVTVKATFGDAANVRTQNDRKTRRRIKTSENVDRGTQFMQFGRNTTVVRVYIFFQWPGKVGTL